MQVHALDNSSYSQANVSSWYDFPNSPVFNSLPHLPEPSFPLKPLDKTPVELTKPLLFWFELTDQDLAWEPQSTPPTDPKKGMCLRFCLSLPITYSDLPGWPLEACCVFPLGPVSNKFLYFNFSYVFCWKMAHHPAPYAT